MPSSVVLTVRFQVEELDDEEESLHAGIQAKVVDVEVEQNFTRQLAVHAPTQC